MIVFNCKECTKEFKRYPSELKYGNPTFCSNKCLWSYKKGKPSYIRTEEHKAKMSKTIKSKDLSRQAKMFADFGSSRKGKTYDEIWGEEKGILIRSKLSRPGESNPNWKNGRSYHKYVNFGKALKKKIKERDGHKCLWCGITEIEERAKDSLSRGLAIHHINHDRTDSSFTNLATLCKSCNSLEVKRQSEWQPILQEKVNGIY